MLPLKSSDGLASISADGPASISADEETEAEMQEFAQACTATPNLPSVSLLTWTVRSPVICIY